MKLNQITNLKFSFVLAFRRSLLLLTLLGCFSQLSAQVDVEFTLVSYSDSEDTVLTVPEISVVGFVPLGFTADFEVTDLLTGTAVQGTDYTYSPAVQTFSIPAGNYLPGSSFFLTDQTNFAITPDTTVEPNETIDLQLSTSSPFVNLVGNTNATFTILNDDSAALSIAATTQAAEDATDGLFTITTTNQISTVTEVTFTVGGTAASGTDYTAIGTTVNFPANSNTVTIPIEVLADALVEGDETVKVTPVAVVN